MKLFDYRISPNSLAKKVVKGWVSYRTCLLWSKLVRDVVHNALNRNGITNIILNGPPSHSKTHFSGKALPLWLLNTFPDWCGLFATHTLRQSQKSTVYCRNTIESHPEDFDVKIQPGQRQKTEFFTTQGGQYRAAGVGGAIQGDHYDFGICDDLYKDRKQAMSEVYNEHLWNWYSDTFRTRINPNGIMIWTMTRWHDEDILGRLMKMAKDNKLADQFIVVNLPAIIEEEDPDHDYYQKGEAPRGALPDVVQVAKRESPPEGYDRRVHDLLGRGMGEALLPERYSKEQLVQIKNSVTKQTWHSLYQGRPLKDYGRMFKEKWKRKIFLSADGSFFEWFDEGEKKSIEVADCRWFQFCDSALKKGEENSYTAIATIVLTPKNQIIVFDMYRDQIPGHEVFQAALIQRQKHPQVIATFIEDKGSGTIALEIGKEKGLPMKPLKAEESKELRAGPLQVQYENSNVFHYSGRDLGNGSYSAEPEWVPIYEDELFNFPNRKTKDQVDTVAHCAKAMLEEATGIQDHGLLSGVLSTLEMASALPTPDPDDAELWR